MSHSKVPIVITGAGQLGSRYLQGLTTCALPLRIYVHDCYRDSLARAEARWVEAAGPGAIHEVTFHESIDSLPAFANVAIVATTADVRPQVVGDLAARCTVRAWVLEKVLAQSESGLDQLAASIGQAPAWVNTSRRMIPWYQAIRSRLGLDGPIAIRVDGGLWGLACNAVHFLDLCAWWSGETLECASTDGLNRDWSESKRPGFWEVEGTLDARFSGGATASLRAREGGGSRTITVTDHQLTWRIDEGEGVARRSDGLEVPGRITHQSEMSGGLVQSIVEGGVCDLPTLAESAELHRVFLRAMLEHWRRADHPEATFVPIT